MEAESMDLKVSELLDSVKLDFSPSFTKLVHETIASIKSSIDSIPDDVPACPDEAAGFIKDIGVDSGKVNFKYKQPESIGVGGSYSIQCSLKADACVDLLLRLPKASFFQKDYLDHIYHAKRCLYLCVIKKYLKSCPLVDKVEWSAFQNEARKPILVVYPVDKLTSSTPFYVRIIPTAKNVFTVSNLGMTRCNIRSLKKDGNSTPIYNCSILEDMSMEKTAEIIHSIFADWKEIGDALILLKLWVRQRESLFVHDCLNGYLLAIILSCLVRHGKINKLMKPIQIFRISMSIIAKSQLWTRGFFLQKNHEIEMLDEEKELQKKLFPVTIHDGCLNLAFRMSKSGFIELQEEASKALSSMEKFDHDASDDLFVRKVDFAAKFDHCLRLNLKSTSVMSSMGFGLDNECWRSLEARIEHLLSQGLTDRAKLIRVTWKNVSSSCYIKNGFSSLDEAPLFIGILLSSADNASRVIDIGPSAENKEEAIIFRKFWGEKAELRRFKDGKIAESTVWDSNKNDRHLLIKRITQYVFDKHLALPHTKITHVVDQLDFSLLHGIIDPMAFSSGLIEAFEVLSKRLRSIDNLPLRVSSVQSLDPALRYTSVFPPEPHPLATVKRSAIRHPPSSCIESLDVVIQLESSGYWPLDNEAIEKTKLSFLLKIAESLQKTFGMKISASERNVDVLLSGYAFRLKIMIDKSLIMLKTLSGPNIKQITSDDWKLFHLTQHASMIHSLHGRYPTYGPVVRLAKRWANSHLLSPCLADEAIELIVAHLFVKPLPFSPPLSRVSGFLRFLRLLAEHDWKFSALIVDINEDMSSIEIQAINNNFMSTRKNFKGDIHNIHPTMFLGTAYDKASQAWTASRPDASDLKRLAVYARSSASFLTKLIENDQPFPWESIFKTPLNNYDAVVVLHCDKLSYPRRILFPGKLNEGKIVVKGNAAKSFSPLLLKENSIRYSDKLMVNFNPLQLFVNDIKEIDPINVWYDSLGGDVIGLTYDKVSKKRGREKEVDDSMALVKSVGKLGKGLVKSVHIIRNPIP